MIPKKNDIGDALKTQKIGENSDKKDDIDEGEIRETHPADHIVTEKKRYQSRSISSLSKSSRSRSRSRSRSLPEITKKRIGIDERSLHNPPRDIIKTKLCEYYPKCPDGDECRFAHGIDELKRNNSRYKTSMCNRLPNCRSGEFCNFAHTESELRGAGSSHNKPKTYFKRRSRSISTSPRRNRRDYDSMSRSPRLSAQNPSSAKNHERAKASRPARNFRRSTTRSYTTSQSRSLSSDRFAGDKTRKRDYRDRRDQDRNRNNKTSYRRSDDCDKRDHHQLDNKREDNHRRQRDDNHSKDDDSHRARDDVYIPRKNERPLRTNSPYDPTKSAATLINHSKRRDEDTDRPNKTNRKAISTKISSKENSFDLEDDHNNSSAEMRRKALKFSLMKKNKRKWDEIEEKCTTNEGQSDEKNSKIGEDQGRSARKAGEDRRDEKKQNRNGSEIDFSRSQTDIHAVCQDLQRKNAELENNVKNLRKRLKSKDSEIEALADKIDRMTKDVASAEGELLSLKRKSLNTRADALLHINRAKEAQQQYLNEVGDQLDFVGRVLSK